MARPATAVPKLTVPKLFAIKVVSTEEFLNQNPGHLGLYLPRNQFTRKHFVENYIQSVFDAFGPKKIAGSTLAVATDGSPLALSMTRVILRVAAGNAASRVIVGAHGRLSAPALSAVLREQETVGGFYLSGDGGRRAEHEERVSAKETDLYDVRSNDPNDDYDKFVIQTFMGNGGLASESFNNEIFKKARYITKYRITNDFPSTLFEEIGNREIFVEGRGFNLDVIDPVAAYVRVLNRHFDMDLLRLWARCFPKRVVIGVGGGQMELYAKHIFGEIVGLKATSFVDCKGAWKQLDRIGDVEEIYEALRSSTWDFGISLSPDGRRCAFLDSDGHLFNPGTMLGLLASNAAFLFENPKPEASAPSSARPSAGSNATLSAIAEDQAKKKAIRRRQKQRQQHPPSGFARTMTTGRSIDDVAAERGVEMHVTPPEWRHFQSLLDAGRAVFFGDDSFQMGSFHLRVPDGIWAALATMSMLAVAEAEVGGANMNEEEEVDDGEEVPKLSTDSSNQSDLKKRETRPVDVRIIATKHYQSILNGESNLPARGPAWNPLRRLLTNFTEVYGRHFCTRMDFLKLNPTDALKMFEKLQIKIRSPIVFAHAWFHYGPHSYQVLRGEEFQYVDPVELTTTLTTNCIQIFLHDKSIISFRLYRAEDGIAFRISVDKYEKSVFLVSFSRDAHLLPLVKIAEEMSQVQKFTGKAIPDTKF